MKNLKLMYLAMGLIVSLLSFTSCSDDDDGPSISSPNVSFTNNVIEADFFQAGSITPTIVWNGAQGVVSLSQSIQGLSINAATGGLTWTNQLPPGTHNVEVIASNSAGSVVVPIQIDNTLQGVFTGVYNSSSFFEFEFNRDGTAIIRADSETSPNLASGTWTRTGNTLVVDYTYEGGSELSTSGTLDQRSSSVIYDGDWFFNHGAGGSPSGDFEVTLD